MKKIVLVVMTLLALLGVVYAAEPLPSGDLFTGSKPLPDLMGNSIPDTTIITASGTRTYVVDTRRQKTVVADLVASTATTVAMWPMINYDDHDSTESPKYNSATLGAPSKTCSISALASEDDDRCMYENVFAPKMKIVVTNAEASDMTSYTFTVRGAVR